MENLIQFYLPCAALLAIIANGLFIKKTFLNWLPLVFLVAGLGKFFGSQVVSDTGEIPSIVQNGPISILLIATFLALSFRQFLSEKGKMIQFVMLGSVYIIGTSVALMIEGNFTSGLSVFNGPKLIFGVVLNIVILAVVFLKFSLVNKIIKVKREDSLALLYKATLFMMIGFAVFLGVFLTGWYGVVFFTSLFIPTLIIISNNENEKFLQMGAVSITAILGIIYLTSFAGDLTFELVKSHLIWGALVTGFMLIIGFFQNLMPESRKLLIGAMSLILIGMTFGLGYLYNIKESMGGVITYSGLLIGVALLVFNSEFKVNFSYSIHNSIVVMSSVFLFAPMFTVIDPFADKGSNADKLEGDQKKVEVVNEKGEKVVLEMNDITEAIGEWDVFLDNSKLKFIVTSHGDQTKGTFKSFSGKINIAEKLEDCEVNMLFDASSISTFNSSRDKEIKNGSDWMDISNFPELSYKAKGFQLKGDKYIVSGELTMKGITKKAEVEFLFDGKGSNEGKDFVIISGKLKIDMTNFGIPQSSEVDKGVEIEFTIEANKVN
jgi:polyisoprenoid-binding protein YceI